MARTVKDLATLLDVMVGYDPEDPITARGVGRVPDTFTMFLHKDGLRGARLGILRESIGLNSETDSEDFKKVTEVFDRAVGELRAAGAEVVDPIVIPQIKDGINPPFVDQKGAPHLNTFLVYVPTIVVPAGFTRDNLPASVCFIGRPYDDGNLIKFAYSYEQATHHRRPPASTTGL